MKKLFLLLFMLASTLAFAQEQQVTTFLGIPVDGFKKDMIQKLEAKGYEYDSASDRLTGEFNGKLVYIYVGTNNNKVYRIVVADQQTCSESQIKIRYNTLCHQFENNPRYISKDSDQTIPEDTDISYEMTVHDKEFQAAYYQKIHDSDTLAIRELAYKAYLKTLEEAPLDSATIKGMTVEEVAKFEEALRDATYQILLQKLQNKLQVWFTICEFKGEYCILMYYDNLYNQADGEDL